FPYLADDEQIVANNFKAEKTPHAFVIWRENEKWVIKYSGAIDDNGAEPEKVQHSYVKEALEELLAGKEVSTPTTKSVGCAIHYKFK
ncbi:MAG: thioredoxin family protein, partial [Bacteroidota bacterium]